MRRVSKVAAWLKITLLHGCFSRFLNCTNGTKSRKASHINNWKKHNNFDVLFKAFFRDRLQIALVTLDEFKQIDQLL